MNPIELSLDFCKKAFGEELVDYHVNSGDFIVNGEALQLTKSGAAFIRNHYKDEVFAEIWSRSIPDEYYEEDSPMPPAPHNNTMEFQFFKADDNGKASNPQ
jgi:hypothetical protein